MNVARTVLRISEADGVVAGMSINLFERKQKYDFSDPYYETGVSPGVAKNSGIKGYAHLKGKTSEVKHLLQDLKYAQSIKDNMDSN